MGFVVDRLRFTGMALGFLPEQITLEDLVGVLPDGCGFSCAIGLGWGRAGFGPSFNGWHKVLHHTVGELVVAVQER